MTETKNNNKCICNSLNLSYYTLDWRGVERCQRATVILAVQVCVTLTETVCTSNVKKSRENVGKAWKEGSKHGALCSQKS